jgi:hypothetical protein
MSELIRDGKQFEIQKLGPISFYNCKKKEGNVISHDGKNYTLITTEKNKKIWSIFVSCIAYALNAVSLTITLGRCGKLKSWKDIAKIQKHIAIANEITSDVEKLYDIENDPNIVSKFTAEPRKAIKTYGDIVEAFVFLDKYKPKKHQDVQRYLEVFEELIFSLSEIDDKDLSAYRKFMISARIGKVVSSIRNTKIFGRKKIGEELAILVQKDLAGAKCIIKSISVGMPLRHLRSPEVTKLMFDNHIYERMIAMGHSFRCNEKGEALFPAQEKIHLKEKDIMLRPEEELNKEFKGKKKRIGPQPLYRYSNGRKSFSFLDYSDVTFEEYKTHVAIENISRLYEMNEGKKIFCESRRDVSGERIYQKEIFEDDFFEDEDLMRMCLNDDGKVRNTLPSLVFPSQDFTIEQLKKQNLINGDGSLCRDVEYLGSGFVHRSSKMWKTLEPIMTLPEKQRPKDYVLEAVTSFKGKKITNISGHSYLRIVTPEGELYTVGLSTDKQSLDAHQAQILSVDERFFSPKSTFHEVFTRYKLQDKKAFTKLMKYLETLQNYNEDSERESASALIYQTLTENCSTFAKEVQNYVEKNIKAERMEHNEHESCFRYSKPGILREKIKSKVIHAIMYLSVACALKSTSLKNKSIYGFNLKDLSVGVDVGGYKDFASIEDKIKTGTFKIYLPRDLAIDTLSATTS